MDPFRTKRKFTMHKPHVNNSLFSISLKLFDKIGAFWSFRGSGCKFCQRKELSHLSSVEFPRSIIFCDIYEGDFKTNYFYPQKASKLFEENKVRFFVFKLSSMLSKTVLEPFRYLFRSHKLFLFRSM